MVYINCVHNRGAVRRRLSSVLNDLIPRYRYMPEPFRKDIANWGKQQPVYMVFLLLSMIFLFFYSKQFDTTLVQSGIV